MKRFKDYYQETIEQQNTATGVGLAERIAVETMLDSLAEAIERLEDNQK